eukprot:scaffold34322_cov160-Skeletonema_menzelii.AAC.7
MYDVVSYDISYRTYGTPTYNITPLYVSFSLLFLGPPVAGSGAARGRRGTPFRYRFPDFRTLPKAEAKKPKDESKKMK